MVAVNLILEVAPLHERGKLLGNVAFDIARRRRHLFRKRRSTIEHGENVFDILAAEDIAMAAPQKRFQFGRNKVRRCDQAN